jgi:hypothetical protein
MNNQTIEKELEQVEEAIQNLENLRGIMTEDQLRTALAPLLQKKADLQSQLSGTTYSVSVSGGGAIAQGSGATAVGERGVNIGGNVTGNIITGDTHATTNIIYGVTSASGAAATLPPMLSPLRQQMIESFNLDELQLLASDLGVAYDDLPHDTRSELAESLIMYCHRNSRLPALLTLCRNQRPHINWPRIS